jgi:hypothetical protein
MLPVALLYELLIINHPDLYMWFDAVRSVTLRTVVKQFFVETKVGK